MNKKLYLLATILSMTILCFSCSAQTEVPKTVNQDKTIQTDSSKNVSSVKNEIDTSNWKIYKDTKNGYSFRYPPNLTIQKKKNEVRLFHTVNFKHQDPCDGRDEPPMQEKLVDFDLTFKTVKKSFQNRKWEESDQNAEFKLGKLNAEGKIKSHSYDGCGYDEYIFPFGANESFIMERQIIGMFSPVYTDFPGVQEAKNLLDLLENEDNIIKEILESFDCVKK